MSLNYLDCLSCGACCKYFDLPVARLPNDTKKWISYHKGVSVVDKGDVTIIRVWSRCHHLGEDNKCRIYDNRPLVCRVFKKEGAECRKSRSMLKIEEKGV